METPKGHTIARDKISKKWFYVESYKGKSPVLSTTPADKVPPGHLKKHIKPERVKQQRPSSRKKDDSDDAAYSASSSSGDILAESASPSSASVLSEVVSGKLLFILVEFNDQGSTYSEGEWAGFLSNNIANFFNTASYGQVDLSPAQENSGTPDDGVIGWLSLDQNHPGSDGNFEYEEMRQLAYDSIVEADPYIDYSLYDINNDGYVDSDELAVTIVVAGYENAYGGDDAYTPNVWGHKWSLLEPAGVDGVTVGSYHNNKGGYAMFGEVHQNSASNGHQATMGIMVHELGHLIFGFPDLYDTDGSSSGIGSFCLMSGGSWGRKSGDSWFGETPVLPSAWIKQSAGWVNTASVCGLNNITAAGDSAATSSNTVFRLETDNYPSEYFLVENRQYSGYDQGLEGLLGNAFGGLAIFHVDDTQTDNTNDAHRWVDLEEADGIQMGTEDGTAAKLWFDGQTANEYGFGDSVTSTPNSDLYSGSASSVSVSDLSVSGPAMSATFGTDANYCYPDGVLLYEDFDGKTPHLGWSVIDNEGDGRVWTFEPYPASIFWNMTGGIGNYANADSDYYYFEEGITDGGMDTELISPAFDPSNHEKLHLSFRSYWHDNSGEELNADIRCDGDWITIWDQTDAQPRVGENISIEITPFTAGQSQCQIRFHYYNALAYMWEVDDIEVSGPLSQAGYTGDTYALPAEQWRIIGLPRDPGSADTVSDLFGDDLDIADYDNGWIVFERNKVTDAYEALSETSPLNMGEGYWIYSYDPAILDIPGLPTTATYSQECPNGCFEIPLIKASSVTGSHRYNLIGHPFDHTVDWGDVRVKVESGGVSTFYTPSAAELAGYFSRILYKYSGSSWEVFTDTTPGTLGALEEFDGGLVKVLGGPIVDTYDTVSLYIPVADPPSAAVYNSPANTTNKSLAAADTGWYVRLIARDAANNLLDQGNVLGQSTDSIYGYDLNDLVELPPMSGNYLTIVFPHTDWGEQSGDYTTDFHLLSKKTRKDSWQFEVRTNDPQRVITLSWEGLPEILKRSVLIDEETGDIIRAKSESEYTFTMGGESRRFTWKKK